MGSAWEDDKADATGRRCEGRWAKEGDSWSGAPVPGPRNPHPGPHLVAEGGRAGAPGAGARAETRACVQAGRRKVKGDVWCKRQTLSSKNKGQIT